MCLGLKSNSVCIPSFRSVGPTVVWLKYHIWLFEGQHEHRKECGHVKVLKRFPGDTDSKSGSTVVLTM